MGNAHTKAKGLWALGGPDDLQRTPDTALGIRPRESWDEGTAKLYQGGADVSEPLNPHMGQEGLFLKNGVQSRGQNRTRESRPSGIVGGLAESWTMGELGTRCTTERVQVGNSPPTAARAAFLSRHPHAACDVAEAGNGVTGRTEAPADGESRRQTATPRPYGHRACFRPYNILLPGAVDCLPCLRHLRPRTACAPAELSLQAALDPAIASRAQKGECVTGFDHFDLLPTARN